MRFAAVVLSALVLSASVSVAQTGFSRQTYPAVLPPSSDNNKVLSADFNGDGRADLLSYGSRYPYGGQNAPPGNVFINNGNGGFLAPVALSGVLPMEAAAIGDVNGDGRPDIVGCANAGSSMGPQAYLFVYLNKGDGTFNYYPQGYVNTQCSGLALGDVYQNGRLDVVTAGSLTAADGTVTNNLDIFNNDGKGNFTLAQSSSPSLDDPATSSTFTNCGLIDVVGGDFRQSNQFDLMLTTQCHPKGQNVPVNVGTTFFSPESPSGSSGGTYTTFNHVDSAYEIYTNGKSFRANPYASLDVVYLGDQNGSSGDLVYVKNNGSSFAVSQLLSGPYAEGVAAGDFNGDSYNDLAAANDPNTSNTGPAGPPNMTILVGEQGGGFVNSQSFNNGTATQIGGGVTTNDFNGDGKPDIATLVYDIGTKATSLVVLTNTQTAGTSGCVDSNPATPNLICSPSSGSTDNSPVTVNAASNVTGFTLNRLYLDNQSVYQTTSQQVSTPINATNGTHRLVLVSYNNAGQAFASAVSFTVGTSPGSGCLPASPGVSICSPSNGSTDNPPVAVTAGARAQSGNITAIRIYVDNVARGTYSNPSASPTFSINQGGFDFGGGTHHLVIVGYESTGGAVTNSINFSEPSEACAAPTSGSSLKLCSPSSGSIVASPLTVSANAYTQSGYIASMRIYVDNVSVALINNSQNSQSFTINQSVSAASGKHTLVVVAYPSGGGSLSSQETITVQ